MNNKLVRLTESDLYRIVKESVNRILKESTVNINQNAVNTIKKLVISAGGYIHVDENDVCDLQIYDGGFDAEGESHGVLSMTDKGLNMDDGDFYPYEDLSLEDLKNIIDYAEWYIKS